MRAGTLLLVMSILRSFMALAAPTNFCLGSAIKRVCSGVQLAGEESRIEHNTPAIDARCVVEGARSSRGATATHSHTTRSGQANQALPGDENFSAEPLYPEVGAVSGRSLFEARRGEAPSSEDPAIARSPTPGTLRQLATSPSAVPVQEMLAACTHSASAVESSAHVRDSSQPAVATFSTSATDPVISAAASSTNAHMFTPSMSARYGTRSVRDWVATIPKSSSTPPTVKASPQSNIKYFKTSSTSTPFAGGDITTVTSSRMSAVPTVAPKPISPMPKARISVGDTIVICLVSLGLMGLAFMRVWGCMSRAQRQPPQPPGPAAAANSIPLVHMMRLPQ